MLRTASPSRQSSGTHGFDFIDAGEGCKIVQPTRSRKERRSAFGATGCSRPMRLTVLGKFPERVLAFMVLAFTGRSPSGGVCVRNNLGALTPPFSFRVVPCRPGTVRTVCGRHLLHQCQVLLSPRLNNPRSTCRRRVGPQPGRRSSALSRPGVGIASDNQRQPYAKAITHAPVAPLWGEDEEREPVPLAGDAERQVPDARRRVSGRRG